MPRDVRVVSWRFVVLWTLMFWQGGFLFYSAAVVPTAQDVIGHRQQGFITRRVVHYLNVSAVVALIVLAIDNVVFPDPRPRRRRILWSLWLGMAICQAILFAIYPQMDVLLDPESLGVERGFRRYHRIYLWTHTVQWGLAVAMSAFVIAAWRCRDSQGVKVPSE